jgi:PHP family Zn ribbon phosphoesterase
MLHKLGNEMFILMEAPLEAIQKASNALIAEGIRRVRAGEVNIAAGYDGEYGTIKIFTPDERKAEVMNQDQLTLF